MPSKLPKIIAETSIPRASSITNLSACNFGRLKLHWRNSTPVTRSTVYYKLKKAIILAKQCAECKKRVRLDEAIRQMKAAGILWPTDENNLLLSRTMHDMGPANLSMPRSTFITIYSKVTPWRSEEEAQDE